MVVTGASGGVGRATARAFGASGSSVALLAARGEHALEQAAREVREAGGRALPWWWTSPTRRPWTRRPPGSRGRSARSTSGWGTRAFSTVFAPGGGDRTGGTGSGPRR
ncbi:SDR family NAD(P)-dependent oxidoreductase [Streptomyces thinghirensis]|nr:SDR family NAD(P)-dependent oxidoreductase [Streptomyces thinghirensis]